MNLSLSSLQLKEKYNGTGELQTNMAASYYNRLIDMNGWLNI